MNAPMAFWSRALILWLLASAVTALLRVLSVVLLQPWVPVSRTSDGRVLYALALNGYEYGLLISGQIALTGGIAFGLGFIISWQYSRVKQSGKRSNQEGNDG